MKARALIPLIQILFGLWATIMICRPVQAQAVSGMVTDDRDQPLAGVNVLIPTLNRGVITDTRGRFAFENLPATTYEIRFSFIGFQTESRTITVSTEPIMLEVLLQEETLEISEITVEEDAASALLNRASQSVTVLDTKALDGLRGKTLGDMLENVAGVTTLNTGPTISKPVVRGLHSDRVVILNAGLRQEGQQWGGEHAPEIDPFSPARIEVLKGTAGVEYGIGAIGGVIKVEPRPLRSTPGLGGQVTLNGFSNSRQGGATLFLEGSLARFKGWGWRIQSSARQAGNADTPEYSISNTGFKEFSGSVGLGYESYSKGIELHYSHFGTDLGIFTGSHIGNLTDLLRVIERGEPLTDPDFTYDIRSPKQTVVHDLISLKSHYRFSQPYRLEVQYGFQQNLRREFDVHNRFSDNVNLDEPAFQLQLQTHSFETKLQHGPHGNWFGSVGFSGMRQGNINGETGFLIPNFRAYTTGLFARETLVLEPWTLETGARFDYRWMTAWPEINRRFEKRDHRYSGLSVVLGSIYQFAETWSIGLHVGTAWRPPGVNELYSNGVHHGTAQFEIGDLDLNPERNVNLDATLRHQSEKADLEFGVYHNRFRDYIFLLPNPEPTLTIRGAFPTFDYEQADATLQGLDGVFHYHFTELFVLGAGFSLVRGDNLKTDEPLFQMPSDRLQLSVQFDLPNALQFRDSFIKAEVKLVDRQDRFPLNVDYADPPDGYALLGLTAATEIRFGGTPIRINLSIENLLNTAYRDYLSRYRYFSDDSGRSVIFRMQIPFGQFDL